MLSFKPTFSLSSFTFIKRLFSSSSLSAIRATEEEPIEVELDIDIPEIPVAPKPAKAAKSRKKKEEKKDEPEEPASDFTDWTLF